MTEDTAAPSAPGVSAPLSPLASAFVMRLPATGPYAPAETVSVSSTATGPSSVMVIVRFSVAVSPLPSVTTKLKTSLTTSFAPVSPGLSCSVVFSESTYSKPYVPSLFRVTSNVPYVPSTRPPFVTSTLTPLAFVTMSEARPSFPGSTRMLPLVVVVPPPEPEASALSFTSPGGAPMPTMLSSGTSFSRSSRSDGKSSRRSGAPNCNAVGGSRSITGPASPMPPLGVVKFPPPLCVADETTVNAPSGPAATSMPLACSAAASASSGISTSPIRKVGTFRAALRIVTVEPSG